MRSRSWLALVAGICLLLFLPELPPVSWPLAALGCCALLSWRWPAWRVPAFFFAGCFWAVWRAGLWLEARVPERLEGRPLTVTARVEGLPESAAHGRCRLRIRPEDTLATLGLPPSAQRWDVNAPCLDFWPGDRWSFRLRLKQPRGNVSDGAFDSEEWLAGEGVTAIGMVRDARLLVTGGWSSDSWRLQIRHRFAPLITDNPRAGIALALLTGDRNAVTSQDRDIFLRAGTSHLMAISGVHVLLFAMALALLTERALRQRPGIFRTAPWPRLRWAIVLIAATAYGLLSGLSLPTVRTLVMVGLCALTAALKRHATPGDLLIRSAGLVLLADPLAVHETAFWLSFLAVGLLALHAGRESLRQPGRAFLHAQFYLFLTLTPLTLWSFGQVSLMTPLTNALAIPVISFAVVPLDLAGLVLGGVSETAGMACWFWAGSVVDMLVHLLDRMTAWQGVMVHVAPGPRGVVFLALAALSALTPPVIAPRWVALLWLLPLLSPARTPPAGGMRMAVLDVGQGLAVVLETRHHVLLYDTGPTETTGARTIVPWLRQAGHRQLDRLVISHNDSDHSGGAQAVIDSLPVARGEYSSWPMLYAYPAGSSAGFCRAGDHWQWDGVAFAYLSPGTAVDGLDENNRSCVLKVRGPGWSVLLTGDIEQPAEQSLLDAGAGLNARVLILGHHGSKTSSGEAFLRAVAPERAVVSAGYRNRFGHPSPVVLQRLLRLGIPVDSTVARGTLRYDFGPDGKIRMEGARDIRHYWRN